MLSGRLKAIVQMVPETQTVADIGCDHGKVAVWLVSNDRAQSAICGDISGRSLDKARKLVAAKKLEDGIALREGSGFDVIEKGEAQVAVLAGMGGELIARILGEGGEKLPDTLVLSCNKGSGMLRSFLSGAGFAIEDEELVFENRLFYPVMLARRGKQELSDIELEFGPVMLQKKPKILKVFVKNRIDKTKAIRDKLRKTKTPRTQEILEEINERLKTYAEVLKCL